MDYSIVIRPLSKEEGGGYLALFPDLPGCMSDGETPEEALANAREAFDEWMETNARHGRRVPAPGTAARIAKERDEGYRRVLSELDGRLEEVETNVADLHEKIDAVDAWGRFSEVTGLIPPDQSPARQRRQHC